MFPPSSSSEEVSETPNAVLRNSKFMNDVPERLNEFSCACDIFCESNEILSATAQNSTVSSVHRELVSCSENSVPVTARAATVDPRISGVQSSNVTDIRCMSLQKVKVCCYSKDQGLSTISTQQKLTILPHSLPSNTFVSIVMTDHDKSQSHKDIACDEKHCSEDHGLCSYSKSEALCHKCIGKGNGGARADPISLSIPQAKRSLSVISSSTQSTTGFPSDVTDCGEEFSSHLCSSSSNNSLSDYAQRQVVDSKQSKTSTEIIHSGSIVIDNIDTRTKIKNENNNSLSGIESEKIQLTGIPSCTFLLKDIGTEGICKSETSNLRLCTSKNYSLNNEVGFAGVSESDRIVLPECTCNIPVLQEEKSDPVLLAHTCINSTVQGITDSDPPASLSFYCKCNNSNKISDKISYTNNSKEDIAKELKVTKHHEYRQFSCRDLIGPASNVRWGIPYGLGLRGGGESTLASGTSSWNSTSGTNSNNNSSSNNNNNNPNSNTSGWNTGSSNQVTAQPPNQWGNSGNTGNSNNNNVNRNSSTGGNSNAPQGANGQPNSGNSTKSGNTQANQSQQSQQPASTQSSQQSSQQSQNGSTSWAQAAGKGLVTNPPVVNSGNNGSSNNSTVTGTSNNSNSSSSNSSSTTSNTNNSNSGSSSTKQQLEQLNCMREALFSQDGWGGQHVNQDTGWDIPASPEPGVKDGVPVWKPNVNNGTDLWEANLRNGGQPPPSQTQKTPWGHTPTTNIGGTWGEDDDVGDSSNVWTGVPSNVGPGTSNNQWGGNAALPNSANGGMWGATKKDSEWGGSSSSSTPNWGDPRDPCRNIDPRNVNAMDARDMRGAGDLRDPRNAMMDPREHMRSVVDTVRDPRDIRGLGDMRQAEMIRGDIRGGITGRLNGNDGAMWGQGPHIHHQQNQPPGKMVVSGSVSGNAMNQWAGPPPKDMGMTGSSSKPTGWEEPSPPAQRRTIPNYDDGTSLWGNPAQQQNRMGDVSGKVSHWKDMPTPNIGRGNLQCPPGMPPGRMPGNGTSGLKPDNPLWGHPSRNGSWGDAPHDGGSAGWSDDNKGVNVPSWNEPPLNASPWAAGAKPKNASGWVDDDQSWTHKQGPKPLSKDLIWASKQFRILAEMGYKKDDVEGALRTCNMNLEDALELLNTGRMNMEWRRHEDHSPFDLSSNHPGSGFSGQRYNPVAQQMSFAPPGTQSVNSTPSLMNSLSNTNPSINNINPAIVQKMLTQQPPPQQPSHQQAPFNQNPRNAPNQPSTAQLRMLVQQIQMAVQAGYLNHQILNQPLAPQTLILLNQLLQQIKVLQQLAQQQNVVPTLKGNSNTVLQMSVQITKTKQQINNLQNQIASQQAIYVKQQQQQQQHLMTSQPSQSSDFKQNFDPLAALQSNFVDMSINKESQPSYQTQQSRLTQWKLPSLDKELDSNNDFSRAPGSATAKPNLPQSHSSPNINPLLGQGDGTWSSMNRSSSDTGWPDSAANASSQADVKDSWPVTTQPGSAAFTDLVPEFEPGKPWKGTQMKSIEDDPSITPGSVVRSPLSLVTIKDSEIFNSGNKTSPTVSSSVDTPITPLSLSSSTWSFNPPSSTSSSFTSPLGKLGTTWTDAPPPTAVTSELWGAPVNKSRPPPGLSSKGITNVTSANNSSGGNNGWGSLASRASWGVQGNSWGSTWLLLKNLTPQIDGSTLKTLCVQHGPLQSFHLYLNHGIALAKYSSREEANKAQGALNNCVLGNTTIFAESPADSEVLQLLQHLGHGTQQAPSSGSGSSWSVRGVTSVPSVAKTTSSDTWAPGGNQLWASTSSSNSLWGSAALDTSGDQHRATPSSLNSFLPGDLLGGESM